MVAGFLFGKGPNDSRETPDVLSRGTCLLVAVAVLETLLRGAWEDVDFESSPKLNEEIEAVDPTVRFRLRMVTDVGTTLIGPRGDARGGVLRGFGGNFERADCTRASRRCIWAVRVRMWVSEFEGRIRFEEDDVDVRAVLVVDALLGDGDGLLAAVDGRLPAGDGLFVDCEGRLFVDREGREVVDRIAPVVTTRLARVPDAVENCLPFGVMLQSAEGSRDLRCRAGVLERESLGLDSVERSDMDGDGGS